MLRAVPILRAAAAAAAPTIRPLLKVAAALFRHGVDTIVYGYLATVWAHRHSLGGVAVEILGRWAYGEGSAAEAIGAAVRAACWGGMVRLFPAFFPLFLMRFHQHVKFEHKKAEEKEKRRKLLASNELPQRNREQSLKLPKGFNVAPLYVCTPLYQLLNLAILMKRTEGHVWMGCVLYDIACFGLAISTGFLVQNLVIMVTVPRVKDEKDLMQ